MPGDFHKEVKTWSTIKHRILGGYMALFLGKLGRNPIYYVDGFAGQGRYEDGSLGSPLIVADLARNPKQASRRGILKCINVEETKETFDNLVREIAEHAKAGIVTNYHGTFEEHLDTILRQVGENTAFFFIDPFGTESTDLSVLTKLARRKGKTEVFVRFDDRRIKRLNAQSRKYIDSPQDYTPSQLKWAQTVQRRLKELCDTEQLEGLSSSELIAKGYMNLVRENGLFKFAMAYPVRDPDTRAHRYYLVHFCNFPDGYFYMAHFMALAERAYLRLTTDTADLFGKSAAQPEFLAIVEEIKEEHEEANERKIADALPEIIAQERWRGRHVKCRDFFTAIVGRFGYQCTRPEWVRALRAVEKAKMIKLHGTDDNDEVTVN